jgi:hypothetical protein
MNRPKHISELLPQLCEELGIPCPEEVLKRAAEEKKKNDEWWNKSLTVQETHPK